MERNDLTPTDPHAPISIYRFVQESIRTVDGVERVPVFVLRRAAGPYTDHLECYKERDALQITDFLDAFVTMSDRGEVWHI